MDIVRNVVVLPLVVAGCGTPRGGVIWCEQCADRLPDHVRSGPFEPVRPDLVHGQDGPICIMHQDGIGDALEEETKLCF